DERDQRVLGWQVRLAQGFDHVAEQRQDIAVRIGQARGGVAEMRLVAGGAGVAAGFGQAFAEGLEDLASVAHAFGHGCIARRCIFGRGRQEARSGCIDRWYRVHGGGWSLLRKSHAGHRHQGRWPGAPHAANPAFQARRAPKHSASLRGTWPRRAAAASRTAASAQRRKGLVWSSLARVTGRVGSPAWRWATASARRRARAGLPGSTATAKAALARVYSWPQ